MEIAVLKKELLLKLDKVIIVIDICERFMKWILDFIRENT